MTKVNIVFDNAFEDVDIIAIPDEFESKIEAIGQEFLDWIPHVNDEDYWTIIDNHKYSVAETDGFIKWLNSHYCLKSEKACVVLRNTSYCPLYKIIEF